MHSDESSYSYPEIQNNIGDPLFNINSDKYFFDTAKNILNENQREDSVISSDEGRIKNFYIQNLNKPLNGDPISLRETTNTSKIKKNANEINTLTKHVPLFDTTDKMYNLEEIITILKKNNCNESIIKMIKPDIIQPKEMECLYLSKTKNKNNESTELFLGKKRENENILNEKDEKKSKRGRKPSNKNGPPGKHTKSDSDNIIKKAKRLLFEYSIGYINSFIKQNTKIEIKFLDLDYKYVDKLKKDFNLKLLNMKIKDFASLNISRKYRSIPNKNFNENLIKRILEKEKENTKIINFLNMTLNDLIDILLFKKTFNDCIKFKGFLKGLQTIADESDEEYFSKFILFSYNFKIWFFNKKGRSGKKCDENDI